jgi:ribonuclease P protein component
MTLINTLGKNERLKSRKQIGLLFEKGRKFRSGDLRVHFLQSGAETEGGVLQVGVTVSTKNFPSAHHRNRVKRMLRESWRLHKNELREKMRGRGQLLVFLVYSSAEMPAFPQVVAEVKAVIKKLSEAVDK